MFTDKELKYLSKVTITPEYLKTKDAAKAADEGVNDALGIKNK